MKTAFLSGLIGLLALSSALGGGLVLQQIARRASQQVPVTNEWDVATSRPSAAMIEAGRHTFQHQCARCHGIDAHGDEGPDLHDVYVSNRYIARVITRGIPHEMPSFSAKLTHDDTAAVIAFIRTLDP